jgi:hypothetical protein
VLRRKSSSARTHACRVHTRVNAWIFARVRTRHARVRALQAFTPFRVSAGPRVVFHACYQTSFHWVHFDVSRYLVPFVLISSPVVVGFSPPERLAGSAEQFVRLPGGRSLQRLEQVARRDLRKQKHVDMVGHNRERSQFVVLEPSPLEQGVDYYLGDRILLQKRGPGASFVEITIHPDESLSRSGFLWRRKSRSRKASMQVPRHEQPAIRRVNVRKPALRRHHRMSAFPPRIFSVAHALMRAVFALMRTPKQRVHTSVNAARKSACATRV